MLANLTSFEVGMSESESEACHGTSHHSDPINGSQSLSCPYRLFAKAYMKLDATDLRYVTSEEFRVLTAVSPSQSPHDMHNPSRNVLIFLDRDGIQKPRSGPTISHCTNLGLKEWRGQ